MVEPPGTENMDPVKLELIKLAAETDRGKNGEITRPGHDVSDQQLPIKESLFLRRKCPLFWKS